MKYPEVRISEKQEKSPILFQTHQVEFKIADKKYELHIQTSASFGKNGIDVDVLDVVKLVINDEPCNYGDIGKTLAHIHNLFGSEWYEKEVIEEAHKGWSDYLNGLASLAIHTSGEVTSITKTDVEQLLKRIEQDIDGFDFEQHVELTVDNYNGSVTIAKEADDDRIISDLMYNIKNTVESFFEDVE